MKQYLAKKFSPQRSNCKPDFFQIWVFFWACSLQNEIGDPPPPPLFYISDINNSSSYSGKSLRKKITVGEVSRERP